MAQSCCRLCARRPGTSTARPAMRSMNQPTAFPRKRRRRQRNQPTRQSVTLQPAWPMRLSKSRARSSATRSRRRATRTSIRSSCMSAPKPSRRTPQRRRTLPTFPRKRLSGTQRDPSRCHIEDGPAISPATAQAIACCATVSSMLHDHKGDPLDVGRRHRTPPPALRRAVRERDRYRCQYPGCESRKVQIHHIRHWSKGGKTKLRNLILLCRAHHIIIHDLNYGITAAADGFRFHHR